MVSRIDLSSGSLGFVDDPSSAIPISSPPALLFCEPASPLIS